MSTAIFAKGFKEIQMGAWLTRSFIVGWFFILAIFLIFGLLTEYRTTVHFDVLNISRLFAKLCLLLFVIMIICLTILRPEPNLRTPGWLSRLVAICGTNLIFFGVLFIPMRADLSSFLLLTSAVLILAGNFLAVVIICCLGRSFSIMAEARKLVTGGPYAVIRHPLYLVEMLGLVGVFIQFASWAAALLVTLQVACQLQRIRYEEEVLSRSFPKEYEAYAAKTARLIPGIW